MFGCEPSVADHCVTRGRCVTIAPMDGPVADVVRIILLAWLAIAVGVYLWRLYRRVVHHETRKDREATRKGGASSSRVSPSPDPTSLPGSVTSSLPRLADEPPAKVSFVKGMFGGPSLPA